MDVVTLEEFTQLPLEFKHDHLSSEWALNRTIHYDSMFDFIVRFSVPFNVGLILRQV